MKNYLKIEVQDYINKNIYAEKYDDDHTVIRFCTSWATDIADVKALLSIL